MFLKSETNLNRKSWSEHEIHGNFTAWNIRPCLLFSPFVLFLFLEYFGFVLKILDTSQY